MLLDDLPCPHCGEPGIRAWRKLFLGPARTLACARCARRVSVPWWTPVTLLAVPLPAALTRIAVHALDGQGSPGLLVSPDAAAYGSIAGVSLAAMSVVWIRWVPLTRR